MKYFRKITTPFFLMLIVASSAAFASEQDGQWYLNGMGTYIDPDSDFMLEDGVDGGQISFGRAFSDHWNLELEVDYLDVDGENNGPGAEFFGGALNALYVWNRPGFFSPYLIGGVGALQYKPEMSSSKSTRTQLQGGAGFLLDLGTERLALRTEVLGRWADFDPDSTTDLLVNFGLQWSFGKGRQAPVAAVVAAPVAAVVAAPKDSDGDGVVDPDDRCPNTPAGAVVDKQGCPIDSDGDGFFDGLDKCPNSIKGALIDDYGCGYKLSGVHFGFDSDQLSPAAYALLGEVADRLKKYPDVNITIEGYTDSRGPDEYNLGLSTRRAQSAANYLAGQGVAANRITVVGMGEANPVASNDTEQGRADNRRVVLKVNQ
jgi:OOP family OmpA-OmpF porin